MENRKPNQKLVTISFPQLIVTTKKVLLSNSEIEAFQAMDNLQKAEFIEGKLNAQEQKQLIDLESFVEYYDSLKVEKTVDKETFKAVVFKPNKGECDMGNFKNLDEAKKWVSYMIFAYECVPVRFENELTGEILPPTNIPKY